MITRENRIEKTGKEFRVITRALENMDAVKPSEYNDGDHTTKRYNIEVGTKVLYVRITKGDCIGYWIEDLFSDKVYQSGTCLTRRGFINAFTRAIKAIALDATHSWAMFALDRFVDQLVTESAVRKELDLDNLLEIETEIVPSKRVWKFTIGDTVLYHRIGNGFYINPLYPLTANSIHLEVVKTIRALPFRYEDIIGGVFNV